jgi:hypothetical protein
VAPKHVGGLKNYKIVYVVCTFVCLIIQNISSIKMHGVNNFTKVKVC